MHHASRPIRRTPHRTPGRRRAFSLLESLIASVILGMIGLALASAMSTAQKMSFEGQRRILAAIAADDLLIELMTIPYDDLRLHDDVTQPVGAMQTLDGHPYPDAFWSIGRRIDVERDSITDDELDVTIDGVTITVTTTDGVVDLASFQVFVPEPAS